MTAPVHRLGELSRRQWAIVVSVWTLVFVLCYSVQASTTSWFWIHRGVLVLFDPDGSPGGLHLYAAHPELQIGPATFIVAAPFAATADVGTILAVGLMLAGGVVVVSLVRDLVAVHAPTATSKLRIAELLAIPAWTELSVSVGHLDDALALTAGVVGLWAAYRDRPLLAAIALAVATDCKPWALGIVGLLLVLPRARLAHSISLWAALVAAAWLPFLLADSHTLDAFGFRIANSASSALRAFGATDPQTPGWCRSLQLSGGLALALAAGLRRRPASILLLVIALRMLLDPATHIYYDAGLVVGTLVFDALGHRGRVPWFTAGAVGCVFAPGYVVLNVPSFAPTAGTLRALFLATVVVLAIVAALRPLGRSETPTTTGHSQAEFRAACNAEIDDRCPQLDAAMDRAAGRTVRGFGGTRVRSRPSAGR